MQLPFSPLVARWFEERFGTPTEAQAEGWPAIAGGADTLIAAPTGSGKTLAAFLWSVDRLLRAAENGTLEDATDVVYVSPLKALGQRRAPEPRAAARRAGRARARGRAPPARDPRGGPHGRHAGLGARRDAAPPAAHPHHHAGVALHPPHRRRAAGTSSGGARTIIVDEIHAVAADKRGAHLALSLERWTRSPAAGCSASVSRRRRGRSRRSGGCSSARRHEAGRTAALSHRRRRAPARARAVHRGARPGARRRRDA
jgi:ATP-dependent Lhr-like helicase